MELPPFDFLDITQQTLVSLLSKGNFLAYDQLYQCYSRKIYHIIRYQLKDEDAARDITQEVFIQLWLKRETLNTDFPLGPYLFRIARNSVINHFKKVAGTRKLKEAFTANAHVYYSHTAEELEYKEAKAIVQAALDNLPPQQKQVYLRCRLQGRSHEEVSEEMGISKATVNNHIVKANKAVMEFVKRSGDF